MGRRVFISYSRQDTSLVTPIAAALARAGHETWIDTESIEGGSRWAGSIVEAIQRSDVIVLVLTPRSVRSDEVRKEVALAASRRAPIVPVTIAGTQIPPDISYQIAGRQMVTLDTDALQATALRVVRAVEGSGTQKVERRTHRLAVTAVVLVVLGLVGLGVATLVMGRLPPWAARPECEALVAGVVSVEPVSTPFATGAVLTIDFRNTSDREVRLPASRAAVIVGDSGRQYPEERSLVAGSSWFFDETVAPGASRTLELGVAGESGTADTVTILVPGVREEALPFLRCDFRVRDVRVTFGG